jgi:phosphatidylglycerol:prolipoprotein diacylglycerol transferase
MFGKDFAINPPYCFTIGNFNIYFYGIIIALGLLLAVWYASKNSDRFDISMDSVFDYLIWAIILAVICARLYYVLFFFTWEEIRSDPLSILRFRDGGLAIYGGVIGAIAALLIRARRRHESVWPALDVMGIGLLIGQCVGRWGNFFNREAYGYETDIFCRMGLTLRGATIYVHPTFLYESLWNFAGFLVLHFHSKRHRRYQGQYFFAYLLWYGVGRTWIEGLRADSLWLIPDVIRVSQLLAAVTAVLALVILILNGSRILEDRPPLLGKLPAAEEPDEPEGPEAPETPDQPEAPEASEGDNSAAAAEDPAAADCDHDTQP